MAQVDGIIPQSIPLNSDVTGHKRKIDSTDEVENASNSLNKPFNEPDIRSDSVSSDRSSVDIPESKRRAQNRAAQRAFRERKERHLKELESRLADLETESRSWKSTNMALRSQLSLLEEELQHYRQPQQGLPSAPANTNFDRLTDPSVLNADIQKQLNIHNTVPPASNVPYDPLTFPSMPAPVPSQRPIPSQIPIPEVTPAPTKADEFCEKLSSACASDIPVMAGVPTIASEFSNWHSESLFSQNNSDWLTHNNSIWGPMADPLDESIPLIQNQPTDLTVNPTNPISNINNIEQVQDNSASLMDSINLDFGNIATEFDGFQPGNTGRKFSTQTAPDVTGVFGNDYSVFDPLDDMLSWDQAIPSNTDSNQQPTSSSSNTTSSLHTPHDTSVVPSPVIIDDTDNLLNLPDDEHTGKDADKAVAKDEKVPAVAQKFIPCADVWDRICCHPKFGEIDINSMCHELRAKARCSKVGVVLDVLDVDQMLSSI